MKADCFLVAMLNQRRNTGMRTCTVGLNYMVKCCYRVGVCIMIVANHNVVALNQHKDVHSLCCEICLETRATTHTHTHTHTH